LGLVGVTNKAAPTGRSGESEGRSGESEGRSGGGGGGGFGTEEAVRGVVEFMLSDSGRVYIDALTEDMVELVDNIGLTGGVMVSVATGGIVPPPPDRPSLARLERMYDVATAFSGAIQSGIRRRGLQGINFENFDVGAFQSPDTVGAMLAGLGIMDPALRARAVEEVRAEHTTSSLFAISSHVSTFIP